jgi:oligoendopeptidase F
MKTQQILISLSIILFMGTNALHSQLKDRATLEDQYKWDLSHLFESDQDWRKEKESLESRIKEIERFKGTLAQSPQALLEALEFSSQFRKELSRLYSYASMASDVDTRVSKYAGMKQEMSKLSASYSAASSFMVPELLAADPSRIMGFVDQKPELEVYRFSLENIFRNRAHTGSQEVEEIIALSGLMSGNASNLYSTLYNADFPYAKMEIEGKEVKLNPANFALYRASEDRALRSQVFEAFFGKMAEFQRTFGVALSGNLNTALFYAKAKKHNSTLEAALNNGNIPVSVYDNLIHSVNDNLATFHRYLNLRKRMMGLDTLHYYDLYAPLVENVDLEYSVEEAIEKIMASLDPLGEEYKKVSHRAFHERWIDMYPNEGKRSGAYSNGSAYDIHPYILMNYNGKYNDVTTLTHELGHTMHSWLTNQKQAYVNANYSIFVAEVASTLNEELLNDYILREIKDPKVRLAILGNYLEGAKGTLFRQTQFAEFERIIHERNAQGLSLTGESFDEIYLELTRKYYGHDQGICVVDDYIQSEWSYIPHFYYNFYVYQYATSFTASTALSEKVLHGTQEDRDRYLNFLAAGSTRHPVDLLIDAGVDMNSSLPFDLTMRKINAVMDEMEKILDAE